MTGLCKIGSLQPELGPTDDEVSVVSCKPEPCEAAELEHRLLLGHIFLQHLQWLSSRLGAHMPSALNVTWPSILLTGLLSERHIQNSWQDLLLGKV